MNIAISNKFENINGYTKTKFGWIPFDWGAEFLINLTVNGTQNGLYKERNCYGTGFEMVHMSDIFSKNIIVNGGMQKVEVSGKELDKYILKEGDLLFARRSLALDGVGKCALVGKTTDPIIFESSIIRINLIKEKIQPLFAYYCLNSRFGRKQMMMFARQGAASGVAGEDLKKYVFPIPPIFEQQKISEILYTWDISIEKTEQLITVKERLKNGLMQQILTGKKRINGFQENEWQEVELGKVLIERNERNYPNLELLAITSEKGIIKRNDLDKKDTSNENKSQHKRIMPGDIGYNTMRMWQGVSGVSELEGIVSPAYTIVTPISSIDSRFMGYLFKLPTVIHLFKRSSQGLVDDTLNLKYSNFRKIKVSIPHNKTEQQKIASVLYIADREIELLKQNLEALKQQKEGLSQQLLSGKIRVKT